MKYSSLQGKGVDELQKMLKDAQVELGQLRFRLANQALKDVSQIKKIKLNIARVRTAVTEEITNQS